MQEITREQITKQFEAFLNQNNHRAQFKKWLVENKLEKHQESSSEISYREVYENARDKYVKEVSAFYPLPSVSPYELFITECPDSIKQVGDYRLVGSFVYQAEWSITKEDGIIPFSIVCTNPQLLYDYFMGILESLYQIDKTSTSTTIVNRFNEKMSHFVALFVLLNKLRIDSSASGHSALTAERAEEYAAIFKSASIDDFTFSGAPSIFNHALSQLSPEPHKLQQLKDLVIEIVKHGSLTGPIQPYLLPLIDTFNTVSYRDENWRVLTNETTESLVEIKKDILFSMDNLNFIVEYLPALKEDLQFQAVQAEFAKLFSIKSYLLNSEEKQALIAQLEQLKKDLDTPYLQLWALVGNKANGMKKNLVAEKFKRLRLEASANNSDDKDKARNEADAFASNELKQSLESLYISRSDFNTLPGAAHQALNQLYPKTLDLTKKRELLLLGDQVPLSSHEKPKYTKDTFQYFKAREQIFSRIRLVGAVLTVGAALALTVATAGIGGVIGLAFLSTLSGVIATGVTTAVGVIGTTFSWMKRNQYAQCDKIMNDAFGSYEAAESAYAQAQNSREQSEQNAPVPNGCPPSPFVSAESVQEEEGQTAAYLNKPADIDHRETAKEQNNITSLTLATFLEISHLETQSPQANASASTEEGDEKAQLTAAYLVGQDKVTKTGAIENLQDQATIQPPTMTGFPSSVETQSPQSNVSASTEGGEEEMELATACVIKKDLNARSLRSHDLKLETTFFHMEACSQPYSPSVDTVKSEDSFTTAEVLPTFSGTAKGLKANISTPLSQWTQMVTPLSGCESITSP